MKFEIPVNVNGRQPELEVALGAAAAFLDAPFEVRKIVVVVTDDERLAEIARALLGGEPRPVEKTEWIPEEKILAETHLPREKKNGAKPTEKTCPYCGEPVPNGHAKICGKAECKGKRQAEYDAKYRGKHAAEPIENHNETEEAPSTPEVEPEPSSHPFTTAWPAEAVWRVETTPPVYLATWELPEKLADETWPEGTMLTNRVKGKFQLKRLAGMLKPVSVTSSTPAQPGSPG